MVLETVHEEEPLPMQTVPSVPTKFDAGFAYMSDAVFLGQSRLKYVQIPSDVNIQAAYGIGVLEESSHYDLATKYVNFRLQWLV